MYILTLFSLLSLLFCPLFALQYDTIRSTLEIRAPKPPLQRANSLPASLPKGGGPSTIKPLAPLDKGKGKEKAAASGSGSKPVASGSGSKTAAAAPVPNKEKSRNIFQKMGDKVKNMTKSKDQKNFDKLYGDKNPGSTPNLKKLINKEAEVTTGTTANKANLEKFQKPRYEAKYNRIKPQGDVATAQLAIHNNKYKEVKDVAAVASQLAGGAKAASGLRRRALQLHLQQRQLDQYRVQRRGLLRARARAARRELLARALMEEEVSWA